MATQSLVLLLAALLSSVVSQLPGSRTHQQHFGSHHEKSDFCPAKCECQRRSSSSSIGNQESSVELLEEEEEGTDGRQQQSSEGEVDEEDSSGSLTVRCVRGALNDSEFMALLQSLPTDVRELEIGGARGPSQPNQFHWSDNINRLSGLRRLALVDCAIPALSQSIRLPLLTELKLGGNALEHIQLDNFIGMPMLERLDLSHNRIKNLPTGAFLYLRNLRSLFLSHNHLGPGLTTGNLLRGPRQLKELQLDGNRLNSKQINDLLPDLASLERLELNHCGLNDAELWMLNLSSVPALRRIGLAGNNLTQVPSTSLRALASLDTLDLSDNLIRTVGPCAFCGLNISRVFLGRNLLGLSGNPFNREAFAETRMLELDLGWNHFQQFESTILAGAQRSLEILHLSGNLVEMDDGALIGTLPSLAELHLAECHLGSVPYSLPKPYGRLRLLNLSANGLDHLPPNLGTLLWSLHILDISHNQFSSLPLTLMPFIDSLELVFLHHCPWDCQCAAQPLQLHMLQRLRHRELLDFEQTVCMEPPLLRGQSLHLVQRINDCAVLFGANFGMTQNMELLLILSALLIAAFFFALLLALLLYCGREQKQKGTYITGEQQQQQIGAGNSANNQKRVFGCKTRPKKTKDSDNCGDGRLPSTMSERTDYSAIVGSRMEFDTNIAGSAGGAPAETTAAGSVPTRHSSTYFEHSLFFTSSAGCELPDTESETAGFSSSLMGPPLMASQQKPLSRYGLGLLDNNSAREGEKQPEKQPLLFGVLSSSNQSRMVAMATGGALQSPISNCNRAILPTEQRPMAAGPLVVQNLNRHQIAPTTQQQHRHEQEEQSQSSRTLLTF